MHLLNMLDHCRTMAEEPEGIISFWVFLALFRQLEDDTDRGSLAIERKASEKARFNRDEVREFREIYSHWYKKFEEISNACAAGYDFVDCGVAPGERALTCQGISRILRSLGVKMPRKADHDALLQICKDSDFDGNGFIDFPDFLVVMRRLLDENFAGIQEVISPHNQH